MEGGKEQQNAVVAKSNRRYFHTFDALRFFAFFKVFLLHIPIVAFPWFNYIKAGGGIGVQFFFVLSGFLITYIILEEKKRTGTLDLKNFFVRRVLRIWPLYYLMVLVAYTTPFILEHFLHLSSSSEGYEPNIWVSLTFLENYKMMITGDHANVSPLSVMWSLCIEEHYYLVWGLLLYFLSPKRLPLVIGVCLIVGLLSRWIYYLVGIPASDLFTNIDLFAFGAIPAYAVVYLPNRLEGLLSSISMLQKRLFVLLLIIVVTLSSQRANSDQDFILLTSLLGGVFMMLIAFTLPTKRYLKISDNNILSRMGVYTYGLYLYHTLVINLLLKIFAKGGIDINEPVSAIMFFSVSLIGSLVCSILSYHLFEKLFLRLKRYFR